MEQLIDLLIENENAVLDRLIPYAQKHGYNDFPSAFMAAWPQSVSSLTAIFCQALRKYSAILPVKSEGYFPDSIAELGVRTAQTHRERGINFGQFLGLLKYFRQSYVDIVEEHGNGKTELYKGWLNSFYDRVEIGACSEWITVKDDKPLNEQEQSNRSLLSEKNLYLNLVESLTEPVFWLNLQLDIQYANSAGKKMFHNGIIPEVDFVGLRFPWLFDELQKLVEQKRNSLDVSTIVVTSEDELVVTLRATPMLDIDGNFNGVAVIVKDVTSDKESQHRLDQVIETTNSIMRAAPSAIGMVEDRVFRWVSDRMCEITGYSRKELIGKKTEFLYPSTEEYERAGQINYSKLKHNNVGTVETIWVTKSGTEIHIQLSSSAVDATNKAHGVVFTAHDITTTKQLEAEQEELTGQMQRTQKLESLGVLAGGIAHDFNNMLVSILGNADLILSELSPHTPVRPYLKDIVTASKRAADLCRQLLAYSGKGRFVIEHLDLQEIVDEMIHMLEVSIAKNVILKCRFSDRVPPVEADATQLRQIIMNLVINASEAIDNRSGVISISTGAMECTEEYLQTTFISEELTPGMYSYVEVADTGKGMDDETLEKIFEPFFTTKFSGRGLGLSAVLGIIRGHHGAIKVYSEAGKGTTIKVILPSSLDVATPLRSEQQELDEEWQGTGTILLVDDEETVRVLAKRFLEFFGFDVMTAEDGKIAVDIYREKHDSIDAVLMDLTMPHLDGEGAFAMMRVINPDVRIIFSSGYNEQEVSQRFLGKGVTGFIQKPYLMSELRDVLKSVMM